MYTLLTRHPVTGTGYPVAYMITNDQTVGPINQWLNHLKQDCQLAPRFITIDCCIAEVNAIKASFPEAIIHYCEFHVLRSWSRDIGNKVKLDASFTTQQLGEFKDDLKITLKGALIESDREEFFNKIRLIREKLMSQSAFSSYFERNWLGTEELVSRWGRPFVAESHLRYLTNNYIESWHNQLETVYFKRARMGRLDRLVFVLTNDVEFYFEHEIERIKMNNGKMGPVERELSLRKYTASMINDDELPVMITNPRGTHESAVDDSNDGEWLVKSFDDTTPNTYKVIVGNDLISTCSCNDFLRRQAPCKHMFLLKRYTSMELSFSEEQEINFAIYSENITSDGTGDLFDVVNDQVNVDEAVSGSLDTSDNSSNDVNGYQSLRANIVTLYHQLNDMDHINDNSTTENESFRVINGEVLSILCKLDEIKNRNSSLLRTSNTQR